MRPSLVICGVAEMSIRRSQCRPRTPLVLNTERKRPTSAAEREPLRRRVAPRRAASRALELGGTNAKIDEMAALQHALMAKLDRMTRLLAKTIPADDPDSC